MIQGGGGGRRWLSEVLGSGRNRVFISPPLAGGYIKIDIAVRRGVKKVGGWLTLPTNINWWERPVYDC